MTIPNYKVFLIGDTHFAQKNILSFKDNAGNLIRPGFSCIEEMDEHIIKQWNSVVSDRDLVIHLGDVCFDGAAYDKIMPRLNGKKYLIRGNHDKFSESRYSRFFSRVLGAYVRDNIIFTHMPVHPISLVFRKKFNIHGHLHSNVIDDPRYKNVSVEQLDDYKPVEFEEIKSNYFKINT